MSIKSLVQSLFKLSGSQAFANGNTIQLDGTLGEYIAPCDGYFLLGTAPSDGNAAYINAWGTVPVSCFGSTQCPARIEVPCAKGQKVYWNYSGTLDVHAFAPSKGSS